jgi:hypothetical protein
MMAIVARSISPVAIDGIKIDRPLRRLLRKRVELLGQLQQLVPGL